MAVKVLGGARYWPVRSGDGLAAKRRWFVIDRTTREYRAQGLTKLAAYRYAEHLNGQQVVVS